MQRSPGEKQPVLYLGRYQLGYQKYLKLDHVQTRADSHGSCLQVCLHLWCRHGLGLDMIRAFNQSGIFLTQFLPSHSGWHPAPNSHTIVWSGLVWSGSAWQQLPKCSSPHLLKLQIVRLRSPALAALSLVLTGGPYMCKINHSHLGTVHPL